MKTLLIKAMLVIPFAWPFVHLVLHVLGVPHTELP